MAKKQKEASLIDSLSEFKDLKNIDKQTMIAVLEDSFRNVLSKIYGTDENCDVIINPDRGDFEIWRTRQVVEDGTTYNEAREIPLSEALRIDEEVEAGESITEAVDFGAFGRRAVINLRQALASKILELQKDNFYNKFKDRVGQIISAEVHQTWKRETLLIDEEGNELILPKTESIPSEYFRKGDIVRAVIERVENENNNPKVILSRTSNRFLLRLLELNIPEIADGLITVQAIARVPGERAKIAVESYADNIDPVGACLGQRGSRLHGISRELRKEHIEVLRYERNIDKFIQRALAPAHIEAIMFPEDDSRQVDLYIRPEDVAMAIGRNGLNLKLASMLTGYTLTIFRGEYHDEDDVYLDQFADEIDKWIIDVFKENGYTTARSVLALSREQILSITDLEEETVDTVLSILEAEFAEDEVPAETVENNDEADSSIEQA